MSTERSAASSEIRTVSHRRYWRRSDNPKPWWPGGLLPALGMLALFVFGALVTAPRIEADVRTEVSQRLDGAGIDVNAVTSDGQGIRVDAKASPVSEPFVHAMARSTQCNTWAGSLTCPSVVSVSLQAEPAVEEIMLRPHPFTVTRDANSVTLTGEVPSASERQRIVNAAGAQFDIVNDGLTVSNESATGNYSRAADRALAVVGHLNDGQARWSGQALSVSGTAAASAVDPAYGQFTAMGSGSVLGEFDVRAVVDADSCNNEFANILNGAAIRFRTASADIDSGNETLLEQLAEQARRCPGSLTVAGHTDSQGDADMNQALSQARAAAVRDALIELGIETDRLSAVGYGESQPVADNGSAAGRAQNRRIVIAVDPQN